MWGEVYEPLVDDKWPHNPHVGGLRPPKVLKNMIWQCFPSGLCEQVPSDSELRTWSAVRTKPEPDEGRADYQAPRRMVHSRSCAQGSFVAIAERGTDLKDEKTTWTLSDFHKSLTNVMDINVILRGLRPASINRWTVLPYCSRWLGICFCVTLVLFIFSQDRRYICNSKSFLFFHVNKIEMILWWCLYYISCFIWILRHYLLCSRRYVSYDLRPKLIISRRDIMLRRTKDFNT